jgi:predicted TIM-barrel enzyme
LIGPKLPAVLALIACCVGELDVYFLHHKRAPRKVCVSLRLTQHVVTVVINSFPRNLLCDRQAMKEYSDAAYNDESVLELVGATGAVIRGVRNHSDVIKRYYTKYLHHAHAASLAVIVDHVKNGALLPPDSIELLNAIVAQLDADPASADYVTLRGRSASLMGTLFASTASSQLRPKGLFQTSCGD